MKLLVTGGAGFLGSHFVRAWLSHHPSDEVVVLDLLTYAGSRARLAEAERTGRCRLLQGDICEAEAVREAMRGAWAVVHFAAATHVDRSITDAVPFLRTNVEGTYTLLREAAGNSTTERFVHISTDEVYGPILEGAVDESAPLAPRNPYAASKAAGDLLVQAARATYQLPAIVVRPTNVFGPWQFPEKFIPLYITNGFEGLPVPLYGDGRQRRAWLYVDDLCEALDMVLERGRPGEIYNIAGGREQPNLETATTILAQVGRPPGLIQFVADRPGHDRRYAMRDDRLRALGWQPAVPFEEGLARTIAWYRGHDDWWRPLAQHLREDPYHWLNRPAGAGAGAAPGAAA
ncbi:MAG: dTDP-glucose 4,6-dehydratase [Candidatus Omnitrophica bacterium]|nr:dTDP-glucose 4,6-dehydratase [Candidatus Omnitrophota bacterium]